MKKRGLIITLSVILAALIVAFGTFLAVKHFGGKNSDKDKEKGSKIVATDSAEDKETKTKIVVTVVYKDKTEKQFEISTNAENLGDALFEKGLVNEEEHKAGFYLNIDGVRADYTMDGAWWCITKDGEMTTVGANEQPITDGDSFEITYTPA